MDFNVEVIQKEKLTEKIFELDLKLLNPEKIEFKAGQFVQFVVNDKTKRPYSIVTLPSKNGFLSFCIDVSPMGPGSNFVENLKAGDKFNLQGPNGMFTVNDKSRDLLFL